MLTPFARAVAYYLGGGFAIALFCAAMFLQPFATGEEAGERRRRLSVGLAVAGLLHPIIAATALIIAREAPPGAAAAAIAGTSLAASIGVMLTVFVVVA